MSKSGGKWIMEHEVKIFGGMCVLSLIYSYVVCMQLTVQYVVSLLLFCVVCSLLCSNYLFYVFHYLSYVSVLVLYVLLSVLSVLCFCIVFVYCFSSHTYRRFFSICVKVYWPLPPGGNPFAVNKYIISYTKNLQAKVLCFLDVLQAAVTGSMLQWTQHGQIKIQSSLVMWQVFQNHWN
jgi:hypothetical protein